MLDGGKLNKFPPTLQPKLKNKRDANYEYDSIPEDKVVMAFAMFLPFPRLYKRKCHFITI